MRVTNMDGSERPRVLWSKGARIGTGWLMNASHVDDSPAVLVCADRPDDAIELLVPDWHWAGEEP